ncbi:extradiol dioxygenase [Actibacterium mucosum KCTC 23349]|uniref:Extradiol dioxygenase n=1 Tax=Actibacterium mucosum KCTC 23349 TaxID=1454373 RepID=A0A037ZEJ3_9RHOB|nr:VOC family protein [Actibacterium mucosum]KAJ54557.1 extradiol dioxygenase [Actibacterium mucosum KCTC 23349]
MPHIGAFTILVPSYDAGIAFYCGKLGFNLLQDLPQPGKRWVTIAPPGATETRIVLAEPTSERQQAALGNQTGGRIGFFLHTDNFARDHAAMRAAGVQFDEEPRHEPYGVVAVWRDPWGNGWDLIEPTAT